MKLYSVVKHQGLEFPLKGMVKSKETRSKIQVHKCICQRCYATENPQAIVWGRTHLSQSETVETERHRLETALDVQLGTPIQDLCALKKWRAMKSCLDFLGSLGNRIWWLNGPFSRIARQMDLRWLKPVVQLEKTPSKKINLNKNKNYLQKGLNTNKKTG
jgi:hypothetical protein